MATETIPPGEFSSGAARGEPTYGHAIPLGVAVKWFLRMESARWLASAALVAFAVRLFLGPPAWGDLVIPLVILAAWPMQEWLIHVYLLHFKPRVIAGRRIDPLFARKHRAHHRDPKDYYLIGIPRKIIIQGIVLNTVLWNVFAPTPLAFTGLAAYFALATNYEWMHYLVHTTYQPKSKFYRRIWMNHRLHHYRNERYWFGVSMLCGDMVMHTNVKRDDVPLSETCFTLGETDDLGVEGRA
ncbi:sterol desaturase family protein [bacterium]|nr:sterol desaturase family protein [bacterium]